MKQALALLLIAVVLFSVTVGAEECSSQGVDTCLSYFDGRIVERVEASETEWYVVASDSRAKVNQLYKSADGGCMWTNVMASLEEGFEPDPFSGYAGVRGIALASAGSSSRGAYFIGFGNRYWTTQGGTWGSYTVHHIDRDSITSSPLLGADEEKGKAQADDEDAPVEVLSIVNITPHVNTSPYALLTALVGQTCDMDCANRTRYQVLLATTDQGASWGFLANYVTQSSWLGIMYTVGWVSQSGGYLAESGGSQIFDFHSREAAELQRFSVSRDLGASVVFTSSPGVVEMHVQRFQLLLLVTTGPSLSFRSTAAGDNTAHGLYASVDERQLSASDDEPAFSLWSSVSGNPFLRSQFPAREETPTAMHLVPLDDSTVAFVNVQYGSPDSGSLFAAAVVDASVPLSFWETLTDTTVSLPFLEAHPSVLNSTEVDAKTQPRHYGLERDLITYGNERAAVAQVVDLTAVPLTVWFAGVYLANSVNPNFNATSSVPSFTLVTTNKGATWVPAEMLSCDSPPCLVHVLGPGDVKDPSSVFGAYTAPYVWGSSGVLLAVGTPDTQTGVPTSLQSLISRDGGQHWDILHEEPSLFTVNNGGDVTVTAVTTPTDRGAIRYSLDEGATFAECTVIPQVQEVVMTTLDYKGTYPAALQYVVTGVTTQDENSGFLAMLNFASVAPSRPCTGSTSPDEPSSDYESWTPRECYMGSTTMEVRRKPAADCFTASVSNTVLYGDSCDCSRLDFWCDGADYARSHANGTCVPISAVAPVTCNTTTAATVTVSQGYIQVPGDYCEGGNDLSPVVINCNSPLPSGDSVTMATTDYSTAGPISTVIDDADLTTYDGDDSPVNWALVVYLSIFAFVVIILLIATVGVCGLFVYRRVQDIKGGVDDVEDSYVYDELDDM